MANDQMQVEGNSFFYDFFFICSRKIKLSDITKMLKLTKVKSTILPTIRMFSIKYNDDGDDDAC